MVIEEITNTDNILEVENLKKYFPVKSGFFRRLVGELKAVDDVSFELRRGETLALVGESGCGKTTTARCIVNAVNPTSGTVKFKNQSGETVNITDLQGQALRALRRNIQMIFQDPFSSLNPRMNVFDIVSEPLTNFRIGDKSDREERVVQLLDLVGLRPEFMRRFPHAFSGGQRQRIGIARALAGSPEVVIADEPVSALDVSVQAQILNLMSDLQQEFSLTYLFVSHDLSVVKIFSNRVAVMYVGKIVEIADTDELFSNPEHPYTEALLYSVPKTDPRQRTEWEPLAGEVANPLNPPSGCYFHPRCPYATEICKTETPPLIETSPGHWTSCHRSEELTLRGV